MDLEISKVLRWDFGEFLMLAPFRSWSLIRISCGGSEIDLLIILTLYTNSLKLLSPRWNSFPFPRGRVLVTKPKLHRIPLPDDPFLVLYNFRFGTL